MDRPGLSDVFSARQVIDRYLARTPLINYPAIDELAGAKVLVKHENCQPVGAFKVRGGINLISRLSPAELAQGVIAASTGNHGQSVAYAARLFGVKASVVVPEGANPLKVDSMRRLGAEVIFHGPDFDAARLHADELAARAGLRYVHSANEPLLIAGVGTIALEIVESCPGVDVLMVPVGGGSGASAACITAKAMNPKIEVIAVAAEAAPAGYRSWKAKKVLEDKTETAAEGLATRVAFEMTQQILWDLLDDFLLVSEEEIRQSVVHYIEKAHTLAEGAGAATLAALLKFKKRFQGKTVALVLSGGNITANQLRDALAD